jgi:hypothetical protein
MFDATRKPSCESICNKPHFFIVFTWIANQGDFGAEKYGIMATTISDSITVVALWFSLPKKGFDIWRS